MIKTLTSAISNLLLGILGGIVVGGASAGIVGSLIIWVLGIEYGSTLAVLIVGAIFLPIFALSMLDSYVHFKERPRGLGIRRGRHGWERY